MKNLSEPADRWLRQLRAEAPRLDQASAPRPYWSQRQGMAQTTSPVDLLTAVERTRSILRELSDQHWFAETLGFDCCDGHGDTETSAAQELGDRLGKPELWTAPSETWTEDDLCDVIEVFHDLAARPTAKWFHDYAGCGWHPIRYSRRSGQRLYRWRINQLLSATSLDLRLADEGLDVGRMVQAAPDELERLVHEVAEAPDRHPTVEEAIRQFRARHVTREGKRSAIILLARILEQHRNLLKAELFRKDEGALFEIANEFDLRHTKGQQQGDYDETFLDWIFYWYLATVKLIEDLVRRQDQRAGAASPGSP